MDLYLKGSSMKITEKIWHEYHSRLAAFIGNKVDEHAVDDLLQEVFIKVHTGIGTLKEGVKLESWLYQITRNTIIDYYRSNRKTEDFPDWLETPQVEEEEKIRKELSSCLEPMVKELPEKYRAAVQLSEIDNRPQKEVAEQQGISLSGAKSRVQRGRGLLKEMLHNCCEFELNKKNQIISYDEKRKEDCKFC
jgi:RNA polymerase sigma-70 factor, ECF subfamily